MTIGAWSSQSTMTIPTRAKRWFARCRPPSVPSGPTSDCNTSMPRERNTRWGAAWPTTATATATATTSWCGFRVAQEPRKKQSACQPRVAWRQAQEHVVGDPEVLGRAPSLINWLRISPLVVEIRNQLSPLSWMRRGSRFAQPFTSTGETLGSSASLTAFATLSTWPITGTSASFTPILARFSRSPRTTDS